MRVPIALYPRQHFILPVFLVLDILVAGQTHVIVIFVFLKARIVLTDIFFFPWQLVILSILKCATC